MSMNTFVSGKFLQMNKTLIAVKSVFAGCFLDSSFLLFLSQDAGKDPPALSFFSILALMAFVFLTRSVSELANGVSAQLTETIEVDDCVHSLRWKPKEDVSKH